MSKPSHVPVWATTTLYATSNDPVAVGTPTKNDPASIVAQGWDYATRPDPTHFNHWMNEVGGWLGWVDTDVFSTEGGSFTLLDAFALTGGSLALNLEVTHPNGEDYFENGAFYITATGMVTWQSGADALFASGSVLTLASGSEIQGSPNFNGGTWTWAKPQIVDTTTITFAGTGHIRDRARYNLNNTGAQTIGINNASEFVAPVLAGTLTLTLSTTGAATGSRMRINAFANIASGFSVSVTTAEATHLLRNNTGFVNCLDVVFEGGAWHTSCATPAL